MSCSMPGLLESCARLTPMLLSRPVKAASLGTKTVPLRGGTSGLQWEARGEGRQSQWQANEVLVGGGVQRTGRCWRLAAQPLQLRS
jgi:hypothetical protein